MSSAKIFGGFIPYHYEVLIHDQFKDLKVESKSDYYHLKFIFQKIVTPKEKIKWNPLESSLLNRCQRLRETAYEITGDRTICDYEKSKKNIQYFIDNPEDYVQGPYKDRFVSFVKELVLRQIKALKAVAGKNSKSFIANRQKEQTQRTREKRKLDQAFSEIPEEIKKRPRLSSTENLYEFFASRVGSWELDGNLRLGTFLDHETVLDHGLLSKGFLTREDFLSLSLNEFVNCGTSEFLEYLTNNCNKTPLTKAELFRENEIYLRQLIKSSSPDLLTYAFFKRLPLELKNEKAIFLKAYESSHREDDLSEILEEATELQTDRDCVLAAVKNNWKALRFARDFHEDAEISAEALEQNEKAIQYMSSKCSDRETVLKAVKSNGRLIQYFPLFQNDPEVKWEAVKNTWEALKFITLSDPPKIDTPEKNDRDSLLDILEKHSQAMQFAKQYRTDRTFCKELFQDRKQGKALKHVPEFQEDFEVVSWAVSKCGEALKYAPVFQNNDEIVKLALTDTGAALQWADSKYRTDPEMVLLGTQSYGKALKYADPSFLNRREYVKEAAASYPKILKHAVDFKNDREIVVLCLQSAHEIPDCTHYISEELLKDPEILDLFLKTAAKKVKENEQDANYKETRCLNEAAFRRMILPFLEFFNDNEGIMLRVIEFAPYIFPLASERLLKNPDFVLRAFKLNPRVDLSPAHYQLVNNFVFLQSVVAADLKKIKDIPRGLRIKHDYFGFLDAALNPEDKQLFERLKKSDNKKVEAIKKNVTEVFIPYNDLELWLYAIEVDAKAITIPRKRFFRQEYPIEFLISAIDKNVGVLDFIAFNIYKESSLECLMHYFNNQTLKLKRVIWDKYFTKFHYSIETFFENRAATQFFANYLAENKEKLSNFPDLNQRKDWCQALIRCDGRLILNFPQYQEDPGLVLSAITQYPSLIESLAPKIDTLMLLKAIKINPLVFEYTGNLQYDRNFAAQAYSENPQIKLNACLEEIIVRNSFLEDL